MLEAIYGPELITILKEMEECFPPLNPHPLENIQAIMYRAGQRSVVEWLTKRIEDN
jgi:hypothetical protein